MNAAPHTLVYDNGADLAQQTLDLAIVLGENKTPISLLFDEHAEELSFPQIYLGQARKIASAYHTPFAKATSVIRRSYRHGVEPSQVLYRAMEIKCHTTVDKMVTFRAPIGY
ncbi:hypothetical protein IscW_ISCW005579 [Ixodes scapularis]|uniref:Uncharacterized protein n=1 Tax=Ixodes scapularis TaxID=6945 RepID=B7PLQ6_IXOSC|nr:hypothetical protein IscW_ISCW005579 [Ixodes scapularis]|eukprot:XP_002434704.1 hypothetical protein IscW_ISCW005579 [Ixodes scapularis]